MGESSCRSSSRAARSLADFPELEHDLGLFAGDGALKPSGRALAEQIERRGELEGGTLVSHRALVVDDSDPATFREPLGPGGELFEAWVRAAVADGVGPQSSWLPGATTQRSFRPAGSQSSWSPTPPARTGASTCATEPSSLPEPTRPAAHRTINTQP